MDNIANDQTTALRNWRVRIFSSVYVMYFAYYLCRYNMPVAKTRLCEMFSWDTAEFGWILSSLLFMYALGQFVNGQLADRFGTRAIASLGALGSVSMNLLIFAVVMICPEQGISSDTVFWLLVIFWGANGFLQAMGWSPMVRVMSHWFSSEGRGKVMGLLGTCYQFGAAFSWFLAFFIIGHYAENGGGDWRLVFLIPAILFGAVGILFFFLIRDTPEDVGLPTVEAEDTSEEGFTGRRHRTIMENASRTLKNPYLWIVAGAFFFLDLNRYSFVNWLPAFFDESELSSGTNGFGFMTVVKRCIHPLGGSAGAILAGWATDRFFNGRRAPVVAMLMLLLGFLSILFPYLDHANTLLVVFVLACIGFCTYGSSLLMVGVAPQDFGKKSGSAGATGFIDGMGYLGAGLAGIGGGTIIDHYGYNSSFVICGLASIIGAMLISVLWKVGPKTHTVD